MRQPQKTKIKSEDKKRRCLGIIIAKASEYPNTTIPTSCITVQDVGISFLFV